MIYKPQWLGVQLAKMKKSHYESATYGKTVGSASSLNEAFLHNYETIMADVLSVALYIALSKKKSRLGEEKNLKKIIAYWIPGNCLAVS